jgi:hypothetical protein
MLRGSLAAAYPTLLAKLPPAPTFDRLAIVLGKDQRGAAVMLPQRPRMQHMHCQPAVEKVNFSSTVSDKTLQTGAASWSSIRTESTPAASIDRF